MSDRRLSSIIVLLYCNVWIAVLLSNVNAFSFLLPCRQHSPISSPTTPIRNAFPPRQSPLRTSLVTRTTTTTTTATTTIPLTATGVSGINEYEPVQQGQQKLPSTHTEDLELTRQIIMAHVQKMNRRQNAQEQEPEDVQANVHTYSVPSRPTHDLLLRVALREDTHPQQQQPRRTPVWLFRQAGRHLPEYMDYKKQVQRSFLEMLYHPTDVAECTLQPLRRYNVDAAILFSDILVLVEALGIQVTMPGGVGIQVPHPILDASSMYQRIPYTVQDMTRSFVQDKLGHVLQSITLIRQRMKEEGGHMDKPLIGFSAAPYTLFYYMIGGSSKKNLDIASQWFVHSPDASKFLLQLLTQLVIEYMTAQIEQGCHALQLFEAMGMTVNEAEFEKWCLPCLQEIGMALKKRFGQQVPLMIFARGATSHANEKIHHLQIYDVITLDGSTDRSRIRSVIPPNQATIQGNYDPAEMIPSNGKSVESVRETARQMLQQLGPESLIANLSEGLSGKESPDLVKVFVDTIHEDSEKMMLRQQ